MPKNRPSRARICPICHSNIFDSSFERHCVLVHGMDPKEATATFAKAVRKSQFKRPRHMGIQQTVPLADYQKLVKEVQDLKKLAGL